MSLFYSSLYSILPFSAQCYQCPPFVHVHFKGNFPYWRHIVAVNSGLKTYLFRRDQTFVTYSNAYLHYHHEPYWRWLRGLPFLRSTFSGLGTNSGPCQTCNKVQQLCRSILWRNKVACLTCQVAQLLTSRAINFLDRNHLHFSLCRWPVIGQLFVYI